MNDQDGSIDPIDPADSADDPVLAAAGAQLRQDSRPLSASDVEAAVWRRRSRRLGVLTGASLAAVVLLAGLFVVRRGSGSGAGVAGERPGAPSSAQVDRVLASLAPQPVDPTQVKLVSTVSTYPGCDALIGDLRKVGAEHVGSRGFGDVGGVTEFSTVGTKIMSSGDQAASVDGTYAAAGNPGGASSATPSQGTTLGTNVQVAGVDELDNVKAVGKLIYDLDGKGNLRITDATTLRVISTLDVTPSGSKSPNEDGGPPQVSQLLVAGGKAAIFGSETEVSKPVAGDRSATQVSTSFMTVTFVDATDPAKPTITDRVRVEGSLVSARLVGGEIRLVTTSNMADLGFVMPTTPTSVAKALDRNRRSVASSTAADWIPDWQRQGGQPTPLVPCDRVHVPDTFSGVAMTSMVTFPLGTGRFDPSGTSILAPATTLYAGLDKVAISSQVWVDPIDQTRLKFKNWQTAIHEFTFAKGAAPDYVGSGIVDGSTVGQFAFGEIGKALGVVTTKGTPWEQDPKAAVDLTVLSPDGKGKLVDTAKVDNLSDGNGGVTAVRFVDGRVLVSDGRFGREVDVIDVSDPAKPRRAGKVSVSGSVEYFHPLPDHQALVIGSRTDQVGEGQNQRSRSWVQAQLLDVSNADAPRIVNTWEQPWSADQVGQDHHAFTYWPDRHLAMWGLQDTQGGTDPGPNHAAVLSTDGQVSQVALPVANKPNAVAAPCATFDVTNPDAQQMIGPNGVVLQCADKSQKTVEWPRYQCNLVDHGTVARYAPEAKVDASYFLCSPAPQPSVSRVLVVSGRPILFTDQTLEALDPKTFQSTAIAYHPTTGYNGYPIGYPGG